MAVGDNFKEYKKVVDDAKDLTKGLQKDMADFLTGGMKNALGMIKELEGATTKAGKAQKKLYEDSIDLTKDILENAQNIGSEEFKTLDVSKQLAKARKENDQTLIKTLSHLKSINRQQKQQHKQIQAMADLAAKPFESIDSFIKEIPLIGDLLSASVGSSGWGEAIRAGVLEGVSSGFTEGAMSREAGKGLSDVFQTATGNFKLPGMKGPGFKNMKNLEKSVGNVKEGILETVMNNKLLFASFALLSVAAFKVFTPTHKFANETGLAYEDTRKMYGSLLLNAGAVKAFANEMGTVNNLTARQALSLKIQEKLFGLSAESAAKLFAVQRGVTGMSMDQFLNYTASTREMARLAGVAPNKVLDDMAQNAEALLLFTDGTADAMSKAAISAAKFGLSVSDTTRMSKSMMDYETAITKENEASMLLGKQINFNKARELIMNNKQDEALEAVREQLVGIGDLTQLNFVQREAIASAANLEFGLMSKLIAPQKALNDATRQQNANLFLQLGAFIGIGTLLLGVIGAIVSVIPGLNKITWKNMSKGAGIGAGIGSGLGLASFGAVKGAKALASNYATPEMQDFVMRPGQAPQRFSPDDTLIGVKKSLGLGGTDMKETNRLLGGLISQNELLLGKLIKANKDLALSS